MYANFLRNGNTDKKKWLEIEARDTILRKRNHWFEKNKSVFFLSNELYTFQRDVKGVHENRQFAERWKDEKGIQP